jgi:hypothetical protein
MKKDSVMLVSSLERNGGSGAWIEMAPISGVFQWGGWIIALLSGSIVIYRYFLKRPALSLEIDAVGEVDTENNIPLLLSVANDGRKFGEDVMIQMRLEGMNFIDLNREQNISNTEKVSERMFGKFADYNEITPPAGSNLAVDKEVGLTVDKKRAVRIDRIMFQIGDVVYSNIALQFTSRLGEFLEDSATIRYFIACRSHEPREGIIRIEVNEKKVNISSIDPTFRTRMKRRLARFTLLKAPGFSDSS